MWSFQHEIFFKNVWKFCKILWKWFHFSNWYEMFFYVKILVKYNVDVKLCCDKTLRLHNFVIQNFIETLVSINVSKITKTLLYQWYVNDLNLNKYVEMCTVLRASTLIKIWLKIRAMQTISTRKRRSDMCAWMRVCSCVCVCCQTFQQQSFWNLKTLFEHFNYQSFQNLKSSCCLWLAFIFQ